MSNEANAQASVVYPALFFEAEFAGGPVRFWSGYGEKLFLGYTFYGTGELAEVNVGGGNLELEANEGQFKLSGLTQEIVAIAVQDPYQERPCRLWYAFLSGPPAFTIASSELFFSGRMDTMVPEIGPDAGDVILTAEHVLFDRETPTAGSFTDQDQKQRAAGDNFFNQVAALQDQEIVWGEGRG